jgi:glycosyltransferase involved in cell wall biosynthesis
LHISVVSPVYKAPKILPELVARLEKSLSNITSSFEVILVDDGCPWDSWSVIEDLSNDFKFIKGIKLSRNFGQHYAITAGLDYAKGEWVVVMDCDLQDQPEEIISLYRNCTERKLDVLVASSLNRNHNHIKNITSRLYRVIFNFMTAANLERGIGNFGIYNKKVIEAVRNMGDSVKVFPVLVKWVGFNRGVLVLEREARNNGKSSYTFLKLVQLSIDMGLAFSDKILKLGLFLGLFTSTIAFIYAVYTLLKYFQGGVTVPGYTSLLITVLLFTGLIMTFLGVLGLYISKIFQKVKNRPSYIISLNI